MHIENDDMQSDYDLGAMGTPVRGKHFVKYQRHVRMVQLNDALAERYPDAEAVVEALRRDAATESSKAQSP